MKVLSLPTDLKEEAVGAFKISEESLHAKLGKPHYVEADEACTFGGHNHVWAFQENGLKFLLEFRKNYEICAVFSEPPEFERILFELLECERLKLEYWHYDQRFKDVSKK